MKKNHSAISILTILVLLIGAAALGFYLRGPMLDSRSVTADDLLFEEQEATVRAIKKVGEAVVSVIVYDWEPFIAIDSPSGKQEVTKYRKEKMRGTGFIITPDGFIITNKHVAQAAKPDTGEYRVILSAGKEYYAQLIGHDPLNDLSVIKIFDKDLPSVELGDSDRLTIGMTVIAIGNALGRYDNSATKGIVSGLGRSLNPSNYYGTSQPLENVIQTDASINLGNSGGPLADLAGRVVGVNTAIEGAGAGIGFAIPINDIRQVITSVREEGRIVRPRIGVRYVMVTPELAKDHKLPANAGAWVTTTDNDLPAVIPGSPAALAGVAAGDIILEVNAIKIENNKTLQSIIQRYKPGDRIGLRILRGENIIIKVLTLDEIKS